MKYIDNKLNADKVKLEDANNNYTSENVEGALEEIDSKIKSIEANAYDDTQIKQEINNIKTEIGSATLNTDAINIKDAINEVNTRINTVEANGYDDTQIRQDINNIKNEIGSEELTTTDQTIKGAVNEVNSQIKGKADQSDLEVERARINSFTSLAEGSTTGDAELIDARIGITGYTYDNLGNAVRDQLLRNIPQYIQLPYTYATGSYIKHANGTLVAGSETYNWCSTAC